MNHVSLEEVFAAFSNSFWKNQMYAIFKYYDYDRSGYLEKPEFKNFYLGMLNKSAG